MCDRGLKTWPDLSARSHESYSLRFCFLFLWYCFGSFLVVKYFVRHGIHRSKHQHTLVFFSPVWWGWKLHTNFTCGYSRMLVFLTSTYKALLCTFTVLTVLHRSPSLTRSHNHSHTTSPDPDGCCHARHCRAHQEQFRFQCLALGLLGMRIVGAASSTANPSAIGKSALVTEKRRPKCSHIAANVRPT